MINTQLKDRTKQFAHDCIKLCGILPKNYLAQHISRQLIRASTSVAANYRAANLAQSKKMFVAKISIVIEESDECYFWLEFLQDEKLVHEAKLAPVMQEAYELSSIFIITRRNVLKNLK